MCSILCGCTSYVDENGKEYPILMDKFIVIEENNSCLSIVYDKDTKVMYYWYNVGYHSAMSPYYITKDNNAIVGIYDVNYNVSLK